MADKSAERPLTVNWREILKWWGALIGISGTWKSLGPAASWDHRLYYLCWDEGMQLTKVLLLYSGIPIVYGSSQL